MKRLLHILLFVLPLLACTWEQGLPNLEEKDDAPEGRVTVTFSLSVPVEEASTKALSEDPQLNSLCLAVYGSSGGYKDYVVAEKQGETTLDVDFGGTIGKKTVACYTYKASLQLSNTARTIHFLGNGPAPANFGTGKANTVLPDLLSDEGKTGFWQIIKLPGIFAKQNEDGEYLNPAGQVRQAGEGYLISDETKHYFEGSYTCGGHIGEEECHYTYNPAFGDPNREIDAWTPFKELPDDWVCPVCGGPKADFTAVGGIALIRNWSKIVLKCKRVPTDNTNFHPISFAVINVPVKGTLVPYGGKTGFIEGYESLGFTELNDENGNYAYPGNLPKGIRLTGINPEVIPSKEFFENPNTPEALAHGVRAYDAAYDAYSGSSDPNANPDLEPAVYLYERPIPDEELAPSYVLVYGIYKNPEDAGLTDAEKTEGVKCYYKIDLMAGGKYFPIYRNFKYQIIIETIASRGHATPENAAASAGSADVSADVNAAHLSDISDGTRRMAVQPWMSKTFINGVPFDKDNPTAYDPQLYVVFYDNINLPATDPNYGPNTDKDGKKHVWLELRPKNTGVILNPVLGEPGELGFRPIYFGVAAPGEFSKTQTLRIYCQSDLDNPEETPLYRDVVVTIQPLQPMKVVCKNERVNRYVGEEQEVEISIPDGLSESMFPLSFEIEPKDMTLTPDNQRGNMPVVWGPSMVDEKPSFHFIRTLTWEEYQTLERRVDFEDESRWRPFSCFFKTNCEYSGTTVYVKNEYFRGENRKVDGEYEEYAYDSFSSYRTFRSPKFTTSIPRVDGGTVGVSFGVQKENGAYQKVWVDVKNLTPVGLELENGRYTFTPTQDDVTLSFTTKVSNGDVAVTLSTEDGSYEAITLAPWRFTNVGILNGRSEVAFGGVSSLAEKAFKLGYITDPDNPAPQITVKDLSGVNGNDPIVFNHPNPVSGTARENYREKEFKTLAGTDPVSFTFSSTGYVEENVTASRFGGSIYSWDINKASDWTTLSGGQTLKKTVTQNQVGGTFSLFIYTEPENNGVLQTNDNGIVLQKGGRYVIDASIDSDNSDVYLYYAQIFYQVTDGTALKPSDKDVEPNPDGSSYSAYLGNNEEYVWSLPWGQSGGSLKMNAPANRDIVIKRIILKGFHGVLYDSLNHGGGDIDLGGGLEEGGDL